MVRKWHWNTDATDADSDNDGQTDGAEKQLVRMQQMQQIRLWIPMVMELVMHMKQVPEWI